jgi:hypothetical protein
MGSEGTQLIDFLGHRDSMETASVTAQTLLYHGTTPEEVRSKLRAQYQDRGEETLDEEQLDEEQLDEIISTQSDKVKEMRKTRSISSSPLWGEEKEEDFDFTAVTLKELLSDDVQEGVEYLTRRNSSHWADVDDVRTAW